MNYLIQSAQPIEASPTPFQTAHRTSQLDRVALRQAAEELLDSALADIWQPYSAASEESAADA